MPSDTDYKALVERLDRAYDVVSALSQGRERWTMSVPARPDADPDLVIGGALSAAKSAIEALQARAEAAERERDEMFRGFVGHVYVTNEEYDRLIAAEARFARLEGAIRTHKAGWSGRAPAMPLDFDRTLYATLEDQG
jgi:hypothetical protein